MAKSHNLQAWRTLLRGFALEVYIDGGVMSQPPSLENPFEGWKETGLIREGFMSQPPSLENPFEGQKGKTK